jgi:hypothetical protein
MPDHRSESPAREQSYGRTAADPNLIGAGKTGVRFRQLRTRRRKSGFAQAFAKCCDNSHAQLRHTRVDKSLGLEIPPTLLAAPTR